MLLTTMILSLYMCGTSPAFVCSTYGILNYTVERSYSAIKYIAKKSVLQEQIQYRNISKKY